MEAGASVIRKADWDVELVPAVKNQRLVYKRGGVWKRTRMLQCKMCDFMRCNEGKEWGEPSCWVSCEGPVKEASSWDEMMGGGAWALLLAFVTAIADYLQVGLHLLFGKCVGEQIYLRMLDVWWRHVSTKGWYEVDMNTGYQKNHIWWISFKSHTVYWFYTDNTVIYRLRWIFFPKVKQNKTKYSTRT